MTTALFATLALANIVAWTILTYRYWSLRRPWVRVDMRKPTSGVDVLALDGPFHEIAHWEDCCNEWHGANGTLRQVTHWMPLPELP
jgi:hypothetical protein